MSSVLKPEDVEEALQDYMDKKSLQGDIKQKTWAPHERKSKQDSSKTEKKSDDEVAEVIIFEGAYSKLVQTKERELSVMEKNVTKAMASVQTFHSQQKQLFDEFVLLRQRYDEVKKNLMDTLWNGCCEFHPDLKLIPDKKDEETFVEDSDRLGAYNLGHMLGEGQFATVKSCMVSRSRATEYGLTDMTHIVPGTEYAMKIIDKDKIQTLHSLKRMSNEISILYELRNPHIVGVLDVIQTSKCLYIVTEKGGEDLFEFFDEHPDGVPEDWARKIMGRILKGVFYCHSNMVCHRDLKPENILVSFNVETGECDDLKLCDFGLAARYSAGDRFSDFCGSPGFFAPEMIISGSYFGDKADIWSCGCILLELVLGHEQFCEAWMTAYDYEVLQEKQHFIREIDATVERLSQSLDYSTALNDFIMQFLHLRASERPDISAILKHEWLQFTDVDMKQIDEIVANASVRNRKRTTIMQKEANLRSILFDKSDSGQLKLETSDLHGYSSPGSGGSEDERSIGAPSPSTSSPTQGRKVVNRMGPDGERGRAASLNDIIDDINQDVTFTDPKIVQAAYEQMSAKERKLYDQYNKDNDSDKKDLSLPPIEPQTPNVGMARKILLRGADLANKISKTQKEPLGLNTPKGSPLHIQLVSPLNAQSPSQGQRQPMESPNAGGPGDGQGLVGSRSTPLLAQTAPSPLISPFSTSTGEIDDMSSIGISPNVSMKLPVVEEDAPGSRPMSQRNKVDEKVT